MTLLGLILTLIVVGVIVWAVNRAPIDATIKNIIYILVVVVTVIWLVSSVAGGGHLGPLDSRLW